MTFQAWPHNGCLLQCKLLSPKPREGGGLKSKVTVNDGQVPKGLKALRSEKSALVFLRSSEQARGQPAPFSHGRAWGGWGKVKEIAGLARLPLFLLKNEKRATVEGETGGRSLRLP